MPGASGREDLANLSEFDRSNLIAQLQKLEDNADIVVFDCGAGISKNVLSFALAADHVVVVTTPQPTALTDAYATVKSLHRERCRARVCLFVNMVNSRAEAEATYRRIAGVAKRFLNYSVADSGYMLHDTAVELAVHSTDYRQGKGILAARKASSASVPSRRSATTELFPFEVRGRALFKGRAPPASTTHMEISNG